MLSFVPVGVVPLSPHASCRVTAFLEKRRKGNIGTCTSVHQWYIARRLPFLASEFLHNPDSRGRSEAAHRLARGLDEVMPSPVRGTKAKAESSQRRELHRSLSNLDPEGNGNISVTLVHEAMKLIGLKYSVNSLSNELLANDSDGDGIFELHELDKFLDKQEALQRAGVEGVIEPWGMGRSLALDALPLAARAYDAHAVVQEAIAGVDHEPRPPPSPVAPLPAALNPPATLLKKPTLRHSGVASKRLIDQDGKIAPGVKHSPHFLLWEETKTRFAEYKVLRGEYEKAWRVQRPPRRHPASLAAGRLAAAALARPPAFRAASSGRVAGMQRANGSSARSVRRFSPTRRVRDGDWVEWQGESAAQALHALSTLEHRQQRRPPPHSPPRVAAEPLPKQYGASIGSLLASSEPLALSSGTAAPSTSAADPARLVVSGPSGASHATLPPSTGARPGTPQHLASEAQLPRSSSISSFGTVASHAPRPRSSHATMSRTRTGSRPPSRVGSLATLADRSADDRPFTAQLSLSLRTSKSLSTLLPPVIPTAAAAAADERRRLDALRGDGYEDRLLGGAGQESPSSSGSASARLSRGLLSP